MFLTPGAKLAQKVDVKSALYNAVAKTRGEHAAASTISACQAFQDLRAALNEPPTTVATRRAIKHYLAALNYVIYEHKVASDLDVGLLWVNAFDGSDHCVVRDIAIDHVASLFNLAVCEATLATVAYRTRRTDPNAMKAAAKHFQVAAGYFRAAADLPSPGGIRSVTCDLFPPSLRALEMVMLGNAQQILYEITLENGTTSANAFLARFAIGAKDFYLIAEESCRDADVVNTCINGYVGRPAGALAAYFDVVAQSAQANASRDAHDMPQQLTRLKKAHESLGIGLRTVKSLETSSLASVASLQNTLLTELETLKVSLNQRMNEADEENRKVYYCSAAESVPLIVGRQSVKPADVSNVLKEERIDERLHPFSKLPKVLDPQVSGVAARYSDMVAATVADAVSSINTAAAHLQEVVLQVESSFSFARANAQTGSAAPEQQPKTSVEEEQKALDVLRYAQEQGGLRTLRELQGRVIRLANETTIQVQAVDTQLQTEHAEDRQLRARYHVTRPTSAEIARVYTTKMTSIRNNLEQAANADKIITAQIDHHSASISAVEAVDIVGLLPPSAKAPVVPKMDSPERVEALIRELQPEITKGKDQLASKDSLVQELEKKKALENAYSATFKVAAGEAEVEQCSAIIEAEYGELKRRTVAMRSEMTRISKLLSDGNARLKTPAAPKGQANDDHSRMNEVYKHQATAVKFKELMGHLEQGSVFYSREQEVLSLLRTDIDGFVTARRTEAQDIARNQGASGYPPPGGMYPPGPQYPPNPGYPPAGNSYQQGSYGQQPPYQGPPGSWRQ